MAVQVVFGGEADAAEHLLAVSRCGESRLAGRRLGQQAAEVVVRGLQGRLGALDRDECLGEPVADRLKRRDVAAELNAVQRVLACQRQHRPAGSDQPPSQRPPARRQWNRVALRHPMDGQFLGQRGSEPARQGSR